MTTGADFVRLQLLSGSTVGRLEEASESALMHIIWILVIGLAAGVIARLVTPGKKAPFGFMLTTVLGITGAFAVAYLGQ